MTTRRGFSLLLVLVVLQEQASPVHGALPLRSVLPAVEASIPQITQQAIPSTLLTFRHTLIQRYPFLSTMLRTLSVLKSIPIPFGMQVIIPDDPVAAPSPAASRPVLPRAPVVTLSGMDLEIRPGGNVSIDIGRHPAPTKRSAMEDFMATNGWTADEGEYIGNENSSPESRDGLLARIPRLRVLGVDKDQSKIIPKVTGIGVGPEATRVEVMRLLGLPDRQLPKYVGFDVDDTLLGVKPTGQKEELMADRRPLAEALAALSRRGVQLVFFSDNDSELTAHRIAYPLHQLLHANSDATGHPLAPLRFYASGMVSKFTIDLARPYEQASTPDEAYGKKYMLSPPVVRALRDIVGHVDDHAGTLYPAGVIGDYYTNRLAMLVEGKYVLRPEVAQHYPKFKPGQTPSGHVLPPQIQLRDFAGDGKAAQLAIMPIPSLKIDAEGLGPGDLDERALLTERLAESIRSWERERLAIQSKRRQDEELIGRALSDRTFVDSRMLQNLRTLMGVDDLVSAQNIPEQHEVALERAYRALNTIHSKLQKRELSLDSVTQETFNASFGVKPVILAGGHGARFSSFMNKAFARSGLRKTNIAHAIEGAYCTPGIKRTVLLAESLVGLLVQDRYIQGYDAKKHVFIVDPTVWTCQTNQRARRIEPDVLDPEKTRYLLSLNPAEFDLVYSPSLGHGDALMNVAELLPSRHLPEYLQMGFGEMGTVIMPHFSNASFIAYLEIVGKDLDAVAGGRLAHGQIVDKGHFFFNGNREELIAMQDWEQIPHKEFIREGDRVVDQLAKSLESLELALSGMPQDPSKRRQHIQNLRRDYPYFTISDQGVLFSHQTLSEAFRAIRLWPSLSAHQKSKWLQHFAISEDPLTGKADFLVPSNTGIFRTSVVRKLIPVTRRLFVKGHFHDHDSHAAGTGDLREINHFWGIDPKGGQTKTLAWNLIRLVAERSRKAGQGARVGFVDVGEAPASIKDAPRQLEFADSAPSERRAPVIREVTLTEEDAAIYHRAETLLRTGPENIHTIAEDLWNDPARFRRLIRALLDTSHNQEWQGALVGWLLDRVKATGITPLNGYAEQLLVDAIDAGQLDPAISPEGGQLLAHLEATARHPDRDYIVRRFRVNRQTVQEKIRQRREDLLKIAGGDVRKLDELLRRNFIKTKSTLAILVSDNEIWNPAREGRHSPIKSPEAFMLTGGNSGNFFVSVLPEIIGMTPPTREVRLNSVIGLSPYDDGGGTRRVVQEMLPIFGPIPPPGDEINVMSGLTTQRKRWILRSRTDKHFKGPLKPLVLERLQSMTDNVDDQGDPLITEPLEDDWVTFCHHLLRAVEFVDEHFIVTGRLSANGNSIGNFFNLGMKILGGAYDEANKKLDVQKYSAVVQDMLHLLGVGDLHIVNSSYDPGTLFALLEAPEIHIGDAQRCLDAPLIKQGEFLLAGERVRITGTPGDIHLRIRDYDLHLQERFGSVIHPGTSDTYVTVEDPLGRKSEMRLGTSGMGQPVDLGSVSLKLKGRLVIEQTKITENVHISPIVDVGLVEGVRPKANAEYVDLLMRTNELVMLGPGSYVTSLMPELLSPEIVEALKRRRRSGKPTLLIVNPYRDNETVNATFGRMIRMVERVSKSRFEELFTHIVANDMVAVARLAMGEDKDQVNTVYRMLEHMDEMSLRLREPQKEQVASFSKWAKYSRGVMGATPEEVSHLRRMMSAGGIPSLYEFEDIAWLKKEMVRRGVRMVLQPMVAMTRREVRESGAAGFEDAVGFDRGILGEILNDTLLEVSRKSEIYKQLLLLFGQEDYVLSSEIQRMMGLFPTWTHREVLGKMHEWWVQRNWLSNTPVITPEEVANFPTPRVIVSNVAYTLLWMESSGRMKDVGKELIEAVNLYLKMGGALVLWSGLSAKTMDNKISQHIDPDLRRRIVLAASGGAEILGYDKRGVLIPKPLYAQRAFPKRERDIRDAIVKRVSREFELDKPLKSPSGKLLDEEVVVEERGAEVAIEATGRVNLPVNVVHMLNRRLAARGLQKYQICRQDGYYDIRNSVIERLEDLFAEANLSVNIIPTLRGKGAINISVLTLAEAYQILWGKKILQRLAGKEKLKPEQVMLLGQRKEQLGALADGSHAIIFNVFQSPERMPPGVRLYQGPPGPLGVAEFLKRLVDKRDDALGTRSPNFAILAAMIPVIYYSWAHISPDVLHCAAIMPFSLLSFIASGVLRGFRSMSRTHSHRALFNAA